MTNLYSTKVTAVGGRNGSIRSEDGILDLPLAMPRELGGKGGATDPEQLLPRVMRRVTKMRLFR